MVAHRSGAAAAKGVREIMISQSAEYALRAIVWLAGRPNLTWSTPEIARQTKIPAGYMSKVLQSLARAGLVASNPGRSGGFRMRRRPERISILDVVRAVDPFKSAMRCPLSLPAHRGELCPLHRRLERAAAMVERAFSKTTIAEILADKSPTRALQESA